MQPVLTITLNPAVDVTTSVEKLRPRAKLRGARPQYQPGGGGVNVSRMIAELGGESTAFVGLAGHTGEFMRELIEAEGIEPRVYAMAGETRMTFQVVERTSGQQYRFVLPGPEQHRGTEEKLLGRLTDCVRSGDFRYVVVSGSMPPGLPDGLYARFADAIRDTDARLILDTSGAALQAALGRGLYLLKADREEADYLLQSIGATGADIHDIAGKLVERQAAEIVIVTLGGDGALVASAKGQTHLRPPDVEVKSTVGAGDSFVAALCWALANDRTLTEACRYGVAAAAAAVTTEATELAYRADVEALYRRMKDAGN